MHPALLRARVKVALTVFVILIEMYPRCSNVRVGEEVHPSKVLPTGMPVLYRLCVILVGTENEDCSEKAYPVQEFHLFIDVIVVVGCDVMKEEEVVVHG